jgi:DivIVA domain-containing protein
VIWVLFIVVAVLVVGVFAAMAAGRLGYDPMAPATTSQRDPGLTDHFAAADVSNLHFDTALRGYRMDQVDAVLDRLQDRIAEQEREIEALRRGAAADPGA